jgi:hypothetical protein
MSTRIVDDFAAARFPFGQLNAALGGDRFYQDQVMLFELGGDNNLLASMMRQIVAFFRVVRGRRDAL